MDHTTGAARERKLPTFYVVLNGGKQIKDEGLQLENLIFTSAT